MSYQIKRFQDETNYEVELVGKDGEEVFTFIDQQHGNGPIISWENSLAITEIHNFINSLELALCFRFETLILYYDNKTGEMRDFDSNMDRRVDQFPPSWVLEVSAKNKVNAIRYNFYSGEKEMFGVDLVYGDEDNPDTVEMAVQAEPGIFRRILEELSHFIIRSSKINMTAIDIKLFIQDLLHEYETRNKK